MRHYTKILFICFSISVLLGCTKTEFMPTPEGEIVPEEILPKLEEVLDGKEYTLFKKAWDKSNIKRIIQAEVPRNKLTILLPNDMAMEKAGYTSSSIEKMEQAPLDSLLRYHILKAYVSILDLSNLTADLTVNSLLQHPEFFVKIHENYGGNTVAPYLYQHTINIEKEGFIDNGVKVGAGDEIKISGGHNIIPVTSVLKYPKPQMINVLKEDNRFKLFLNALKLNSALYESYAKTYEESPSFPQNFAPYKYLTDWDANLENGIKDAWYTPQIIRHTLFVPTDEAFNKLGIYSETDLIELNDRSPNLYFYGNRITPVDSLLLHHSIVAGTRLELYSVPSGRDRLYGMVIQMGNYSTSNTVFYTGSLNKETLNNYMLLNSWGQGGDLFLNLDFGRDASNRITVKHKGSSAEAASIVEENINTIQGPIHVVDRLIVPEGFSMWHKKK